ncbi:MAG: D-glycero-beta-D-manno-heptose 1-phosphate adenylyltransferase [Elusimicrobia bacterium]|nr:D-glycero-beta-D-manno-heptose 1-phosphate adenylyltransferase [Elusimicrobiota bacterium]
MIISKKKLKKIVSGLKKKNKKIVFTNGCFDIIHPGHIHLLEKAKSFGDVLIVGLNSDSSVRAIKPKRPINSFKARANVVDAIKYVDFVCGFSEKTPLNLIKIVKPDVLVKGGDWKEREIVGSSFVLSYGGQVKRIALKKGFSTTQIVKKIKNEKL